MLLSRLQEEATLVVAKYNITTNTGGNTCGAIRKYFLQIVSSLSRIGSVLDEYGEISRPTGVVDSHEGSASTNIALAKSLAEAAGRLFASLALVCASFPSAGMLIQECVVDKMELNAAKYPIALCVGRGKCKYTAYTSKTGITKDTVLAPGRISRNALEKSSKVGFANVISELEAFSADRGWGRDTYPYSPGNLFMALTAEVGELADVLQWHDCNSNTFDCKEVHARAGNEIADVFIYLTRLCMHYHIDPSLEIVRYFCVPIV